MNCPACGKPRRPNNNGVCYVCYERIYLARGICEQIFKTETRRHKRYHAPLARKHQSVVVRYTLADFPEEETP